jgi:predicted NACHT family NTPase
MVKRSLQANVSGIHQAKRAFAVKGWTQENLAGEVNLRTRQPISRFFTGKPVDRHVFMEVCSILDLDWREVATNPPAEFPEFRGVSVSELDDLVRQVRSQRHDTIQNQCGILQLLDISRPVSIDDIYVDVNILEDLTSHQWLEIAELQKLEPDKFDRVNFGNIDHSQMSGMLAVETYSRLRMLGKPGVGKTTFLKHLAIMCDQGKFAADRVPIFILLKDFAEESRDNDKLSLLDYLRQSFIASGVSNPSTIETLLKANRVLLLLDGMDEVKNEDMTFVLKEVRKLTEKYHNNQFVVTCRTAAQTTQMLGFTDVEIAPFTQEQIDTFAHKWFTVFAKEQPTSSQPKSTQFIEQLDLPENWQFRQMVVTPLFLHLACWVFHAQGKFPTKRTEFYKQGLDLLLGKWDEVRGVERDEIYRGFLLPQKLRLYSQLASATFENGEYFFEKRVIEQYIGDYLRDLPEASSEPEELQRDSESVLKAIESQHGLLIERARGIFSFSYLAFQEYFMARNIVASHNLQPLDEALGGLVSHITDPHWHEIFLLTAAMLRSADSLMQLMKQQIDALVAEDPYLQEFLTWANQKRKTVLAPTKEATARAFYLALAQTPNTAADFALACTLDQGMIFDAALDDLIDKCAIGLHPDRAHICSEALSNVLGMVVDAGFRKSLQQLQNQLPSSQDSQKRSQRWCQDHHPAWVEQLRKTVAKYRNTNHVWEFTPEQQQVLQRYYAANQLLVDCLNSNCEVTEAIRKEIESTLLLPQQELKNREWL